MMTQPLAARFAWRAAAAQYGRDTVEIAQQFLPFRRDTRFAQEIIDKNAI